MNASIWKYPLTSKITHTMPVGAKILAVQLQAGSPMMWAMVDPDAPRENRMFVAQPTGGYFDPEDLEYIGTFQTEELVFHVFEKKELEEI